MLALKMFEEHFSFLSCSVQPHRRQPTRLPHPWDSPGKNTGVGCHFLLQCRKVKSESQVAQSCPTLSDPMDCSLPGSSVHGIFQASVLEWGAIAFSGACSYKHTDFVSIIFKLKSLEVILVPFATVLKLQNSIKFRTINTSIFRSIPKHSFS